MRRPGPGVGDLRGRRIRGVAAVHQRIGDAGEGAKLDRDDVVLKPPAVREAGRVSADRASWAMDLLLHVATATAVEHGTRERAIDTSDEEEALAAALRDVPADRYPHIAAIGATELMSGPGRLDWGFRVLINGVIHTPRPETETSL